MILRALVLLLCLTTAASAQVPTTGAGSGAPGVSGTTFLTAPILTPEASAAGGAAFYQIPSAGILSIGSGATAAVVDAPLSTSGVISNFCVTSGFTGTGTDYWNYTITYDDVDTSMTVNTLSTALNTAKCDTNAAHNVAYTAGHKLAVHKTATGVPTNDLFESSFLMTDGAGQFGPILFSSNSVVTVGTQQYIGIGQIPNAAENVVSVVIPTAGHIDNLYTNVVTGTASHFWTFTAQHHTTVSSLCDTNDAAANALTVAYGSGASGILFDTNAAHGFDVAAGDCVSIGIIADGGATMSSGRLYASLRWRPTTNYLYPQFATGVTMPTTTLARWAVLSGVQVSTWSSTESQTYVLVPTLGSYTMTVANLVAAQSGAVGTTRAWTLRCTASVGAGACGAASINPTCSSTTAMTGCAPGLSSGSSVSGTNFAVGDWLNWQVTNTATATATTWHKESFTTNVH